MAMDTHLKKIADAAIEVKKQRHPPHSEYEKDTPESQQQQTLGKETVSNVNNLMCHAPK